MIYKCFSLVTFPVVGSNAGTMVAFPLSAVLCVYGFAGGWPSVFYVFGENVMTQITVNACYADDACQYVIIKNYGN